MIRDTASTILEILKYAGIGMAIGYVLLVASFLLGVGVERLRRRHRDRVRFERMERDVADFRRELDSVDLAAEIRWNGRAA